MTEPRRVLVAWDYGAHGIWWVLTKQEKETPVRTGTLPPGSPHRPMPWSDRLSGELLEDLQAWNDAWDADGADPRELEERGRELAARVQGELGADGWEVLYAMGDRICRVHPPGNWPAASWQQDLLGYTLRVREPPGGP